MGGSARRFITSLLCPRTHPGAELAELTTSAGRSSWGSGRSSRPCRKVELSCAAAARAGAPELWGVLIAHTLLRRWMREMAAHVQVEPQRISFHTASYAIGTLLAVQLRTRGTFVSNSWQPCWRNRDTSRAAAPAAAGHSKTRVSTLLNKCQSASLTDW